MNALRDRNLFIRGKGHTFFVDRQRDHCRSIALRHWQDFAGALLAVFQINRIDDRLAGNAFERNLDDVSFGGIHQNRRRHTRGDLLENRTHVALFVFAHNGTAQIEHVRAFGYELLRERENLVVLCSTHQILKMLDPRRGVHLLGHDNRLTIELERNRCVGTCRF